MRLKGKEQHKSEKSLNVIIHPDPALTLPYLHKENSAKCEQQNAQELGNGRPTKNKLVLVRHQKDLIGSALDNKRPKTQHLPKQYDRPPWYPIAWTCTIGISIFRTHVFGFSLLNLFHCSTIQPITSVLGTRMHFHQFP